MVGRPKGIKKTGGRQKGTPNKVTSDARTAIAEFVNGNVDRLQGWLDRIADGIAGKDGKEIIPPNPEKAFGLFMDVVEYHVPKLARHTVAGDPDQPVIHEVRGILDEIDGKSSGLPKGEKNGN